MLKKFGGDIHIDVKFIEEAESELIVSMGHIFDKCTLKLSSSG